MCMEAIVYYLTSTFVFRSGSSTSAATLPSEIETFWECVGPGIPSRPSLLNFTFVH